MADTNGIGPAKIGPIVVNALGIERAFLPRMLLMSILIVMVSVVTMRTQSAALKNEHFEKDGLAFDYPNGWKLTDNSTDDAQDVVIDREGSTAQIAVIVQRGPITTCDFQAESQKITNELLQRIATRIDVATPLRPSPVRTSLGKSELDGVQLHGRMKAKPVTGDVYSVRLNRRFLSLVYLRADNQPANSAWDTIRRTLTLEPGAVGVWGSATAANSEGTISTGVLNGQALHLVQPVYPAIARQAHASGMVVVQVIIDESGDVTSAHAIEGHPLLLAVSVAAARASKFSPTKLCGEPVRVTGVIQYNFVAP
jgi:TonB family protein